MIVLFANILTFSTGSAGLRTNSSDNLLNRNSSFGRPSFFSSWQTRLIEIQDSPFIDQGRRGKAGWFENGETLSSSCLSTGVHLLALFSTVTIPAGTGNDITQSPRSIFYFWWLLIEVMLMRKTCIVDCIPQTKLMVIQRWGALCALNWKNIFVLLVSFVLRDSHSSHSSHNLCNACNNYCVTERTQVPRRFHHIIPELM